MWILGLFVGVFCFVVLFMFSILFFLRLGIVSYLVVKDNVICIINFIYLLY